MEPSSATITPSANTGARVLLGIFILWQLYFLTSTNFLDLFSEGRKELPKDSEAKNDPIIALIEPIVPGWTKEQGQIDDLFSLLEKVSTRYGQITGQSQSWCLFAPDITDQCVFPFLELRWDEDPQNGPSFARPLTVLAATDPLSSAALWGAVQQTPLPRLPYATEQFSRHLAGLASTNAWELAMHTAVVQQTPGPMPPPPAEEVRSDNEPENLHKYLRVGYFRLRRYECALAISLRPHTDETHEKMLDRWRKRIVKLIDNDGDALFAFVRWRVQAYRKAHPGMPMPSQVIFLVRRYRIAEPDEGPPRYRGPFVEPVARWQPFVTWQANYRPVEMYNPVTQRFERMRK